MVEPTILAAAALASATAAAGAWLLPARLQTWSVALPGAALLAYVSPFSLAFLAGFGALSWLTARHTRGRGPLLALAIAVIAAGYALVLWSARRSPDPNLLSVVLPFGMAYYVLRLIHYLVETHKGSLRPHSLDDYLAWLLLPSTLAVGPIHRFDEFQRDWRRRRWDSGMFGWGLTRILTGAVKLILIGNYLVGYKLAPWLTHVGDSSMIAYIYSHSLLFWINLYVQFSGYTDAAVGFAALAGLRVRENFHWPFLATNLGEFWRRWHMSLSSWCRDYVYAPVAAVTRNHLLAIALAMLTLGLWHAISLHYVLWGLYHAIGLTIWRVFHLKTAPVHARLPRPARLAWNTAGCLLTLNFVMFSFPLTTAVERLITGGA